MSKKRRRRKDRYSAGRSERVKYKLGEQALARHRRRLEANLEGESDVREWCEMHGVTFRVTNRGQHWQFLYGSKRVEWWPSSAKLICDKHWNHGIHVHDWEQALDMVMKHFGIADIHERGEVDHEFLAMAAWL